LAALLAEKLELKLVEQLVVLMDNLKVEMMVEKLVAMKVVEKVAMMEL
jgi:hypothetical protein